MQVFFSLCRLCSLSCHPSLHPLLQKKTAKLENPNSTAIKYFVLITFHSYLSSPVTCHLSPVTCHLSLTHISTKT